VDKHEEKEILEALRQIDRRLLVLIVLLEEALGRRQPETYQAPTGFGFKSVKTLG
jgi:hypothetical protein